MAKKKTAVKQTSGVDYPDFTYRKNNRACIRFNDGNVIQISTDADKKQISVIWEDEVNGEVYSDTFDMDASFVTVAPESADSVLFDLTVGNIQDDITITGDQIKGTLKYIASGSSVEWWHTHYFLALKFSDAPQGATIKTGITSLVELDSDMNCLYAITDLSKPLKVVQTTSSSIINKSYDMSKLVLEEDE